MPPKKNLNPTAAAVSLATPSPDPIMSSNKDDPKNVEIVALKAEIRTLKGKAATPPPNVTTLN